MRAGFKKICRFGFTAFGVIAWCFLGLMTGCSDTNTPFRFGDKGAKAIAQPPAEDKDFKETQAKFLAVGDIMLSRGVNRAIERKGNVLLPFTQLENLLTSTDFNFGNLESPISGDEKLRGRGMVFNAHKHDVVGLTKYNFKIVNLANNHAFDQRLSGLRSTQKHLNELGISYLGVGENKADAWRPKIIVANGIKIGFIGASYSSINDGGATMNKYVARVEEVENLRNAIRQLKTESDFIVVTLHAGVEYKRKPNNSQINFAHRAIDLGADLVIGSHPHWIQTFENYRGKYIFYSLGNFIFDQPWQDTREGLALNIKLARRYSERSGMSYTKLSQIDLIPIVIDRIGVPRRATPKEAEIILKKIGAKEQIIKPADNEN